MKLCSNRSKIRTILVLLTLFLLLFQYNTRVFAWTLEEKDLFITANVGSNGRTPAGILHLVFTYPDLVRIGNTFDVGITIQYERNQFAVANWMMFSNVSVQIHSLINGSILSNSSSNTSPPLITGKQYSHNFSIKAPITPGKYLIDLSWNTTYALGNTINVQPINMADYYNYSGSIYTHPQLSLFTIYNLPPISVEKNQNPTRLSLMVRTHPTFTSQLEPINVSINALEPAKTIRLLHTTNEQAHLMLPINSSVAVSVADRIDISKGIREKFLMWSDGDNSNPRKVHLTSNLELYPLYNIQYLLTINSTCLTGGLCGNPGEPTWYDNYGIAPFSVDSPSSFLLLQSFDYWSGDISSGQTASAHGFLTMDGPKTINAHWKWDITYLAGITGLAAGLISVLGVVPHIQRRRKKGQQQQSSQLK